MLHGKTRSEKGTHHAYFTSEKITQRSKMKVQRSRNSVIDARGKLSLSCVSHMVVHSLENIMASFFKSCFSAVDVTLEGLTLLAAQDLQPRIVLSIWKEGTWAPRQASKTGKLH